MNGIQEVGGSTPPGSTKTTSRNRRAVRLGLFERRDVCGRRTGIAAERPVLDDDPIVEARLDDLTTHAIVGASRTNINNSRPGCCVHSSSATLPSRNGRSTVFKVLISDSILIKPSKSHNVRSSGADFSFRHQTGHPLGFRLSKLRRTPRCSLNCLLQ